MTYSFFHIVLNTAWTLCLALYGLQVVASARRMRKSVEEMDQTIQRYIKEVQRITGKDLSYGD